MSLARCDKCNEIIDTDIDPDSCGFVDDKIICEWCREDLGEEWKEECEL